MESRAGVAPVFFIFSHCRGETSELIELKKAGAHPMLLSATSQRDFGTSGHKSALALLFTFHSAVQGCSGEWATRIVRARSSLRFRRS